MIRGKLLLGYTRDALHQCSVFSDKKGTKEPVHSRDGGRYAKACPESQGIAKVSSGNDVYFKDDTMQLYYLWTVGLLMFEP